MYGELNQLAEKNVYTGGTTSTAVVTVDNVDNIITVVSTVDPERIEGIITEYIHEHLNKADSAVAHQFVTSVSETDGVITISRAALDKTDIPNLDESQITDLVDDLDELEDKITALTPDTTECTNLEYIYKIWFDESANKIKIEKRNLTADNIPNLSYTKITGLATVAHTGAASDLTEDTTHRFVTDDNKTAWNNKVDSSVSDGADASSIVMSATQVQISNSYNQGQKWSYIKSDEDVITLYGSQTGEGNTTLTVSSTGVTVSEDPTTNLGIATKQYVDNNIPDVIDNTISTSTEDALSANMGKALQDEINNLKNIGRFLSIWNSATGLPTTNPTTLPYAYKTGDYFRVGEISLTTNYKPDGTTYTGTASTVVETEDVEIGWVYYYDGTQWMAQSAGGGGLVQDVQINGTTILDSESGIANIPLSSASANGAMSSAQYTKLEGIASGAEVNVQSDWDEIDTTSDAYIQNKPTIPNAVEYTEQTLTTAQQMQARENQGLYYQNDEITIYGDTTDKTVYRSDTHYKDWTGVDPTLLLTLQVGESIPIEYKYDGVTYNKVGTRYTSSTILTITTEASISDPIVRVDFGNVLGPATELCAWNSYSISGLDLGTKLEYVKIYKVNTTYENKISTNYIEGLSTVATSGSYNDLSNRPQYNSSTITGSTNIPEVKTATWDAKSTVSVSNTGTTTDKVNYITVDGTEKKIGGDEPTELTTTLEQDLYTYTPIGKISGASATNPVKVADAGDSLKVVFNAILGEETDSDPTINQSGTTFTKTGQTGTTSASGAEIGQSINAQTGTVTYTVTNTATCSYGLKAGSNDTYSKTSATTFTYPILTRTIDEYNYQVRISYPVLNGCVLSVTTGTLVYDDTTNRYLYCNVDSNNQVTVSISIPTGTSTASAQTRFGSMTADVSFDAATYNGTAVDNFWTYLKNSYTSSGMTHSAITGVTSTAYTITAGTRYAYTTMSAQAAAPTTSLTKQTAETTFASNGADLSYSLGDYIYLYRTVSGNTVQTYVLGQWADVTFTELSAVVIAQANGATATYYPYRVGPMEATGSAKYRV